MNSTISEKFILAALRDEAFQTHDIENTSQGWSSEMQVQEEMSHIIS
jgi:hypothetical protein